MHRFQRWREVLQGATSERAVECVVRDYVTSLTPELVSTLPGDCQRALRESDVSSAAVTLLHAELSYRGTPEMAQLLHEIAHTYAAASMRISKLRMEPIAPQST